MCACMRASVRVISRQTRYRFNSQVSTQIDARSTYCKSGTRNSFVLVIRQEGRGDVTRLSSNSGTHAAWTELQRSIYTRHNFALGRLGSNLTRLSDLGGFGGSLSGELTRKNSFFFPGGVWEGD